jgi:hypothetical protein
MSANIRRTDIAFALKKLCTDDRSGFGGDFPGAIVRIVVVDIDCCFRKPTLEIAHHFGNCNLLIVARYQDGNTIPRDHCERSTSATAALELGPDSSFGAQPDGGVRRRQGAAARFTIVLEPTGREIPP